LPQEPALIINGIKKILVITQKAGKN